MTAPGLTARKTALREITQRRSPSSTASLNGTSNGAGPHSTSEYFGINTLGAR